MQTSTYVPDGYLSLMDEMRKKAVKIEEDVLISGLRDYLQREPTVEDFKKCSQVYKQGDFINYMFYYDGIHLGTVKKIFEGLSYKVGFYPAKPQ